MMTHQTSSLVSLFSRCRTPARGRGVILLPGRLEIGASAIERGSKRFQLDHAVRASSSWRGSACVARVSSGSRHCLLNGIQSPTSRGTASGDEKRVTLGRGELVASRAGREVLAVGWRNHIKGDK
jgi:hypothetical protein